MPHSPQPNSSWRRVLWAFLGLVDLSIAPFAAVGRHLTRGAGWLFLLRLPSTPVLSLGSWVRRGVASSREASPSYSRYIWRMRLSLAALTLLIAGFGLFFFWQVSLPAQNPFAIGAFRTTVIPRLAPDGFLEPAPSMQATRCESGRINRLARPGCMEPQSGIGDARVLFEQASAVYLHNPTDFSKTMAEPQGIGKSESASASCGAACLTLAHQLWTHRGVEAVNASAELLGFSLLFLFVVHGVWLACVRYLRPDQFFLRIHPIDPNSASLKQSQLLVFNGLFFGLPVTIAPLLVVFFLVGVVGNAGVDAWGKFQHWEQRPTEFVLYSHGPWLEHSEGAVYWTDGLNTLRLAREDNLRNALAVTGQSSGEKNVQYAAHRVNLGGWTLSERLSPSLPALLKQRLPQLSEQDREAAAFRLTHAHDTPLGFSETSWERHFGFLFFGGFLWSLTLLLASGALWLIAYLCRLLTRSASSVAVSSFEKLSLRGAQLPFAQHERRELEKALRDASVSGVEEEGENLCTVQPNQTTAKRPAKRL